MTNRIATAPRGRELTGEFIRVDAVARRLGVSRKRIYQLINEKRLQAVKFGPRMTRVLRASVDAYIGELLNDEGEDLAGE